MIELENHRLATIILIIIHTNQHWTLKLMGEGLRNNQVFFFWSQSIPTRYLLITKRNVVSLH